MMIAPSSLLVSILSLAQPEAPPQGLESIPTMAQDDEEEEIVYGWSGAIAVGASMTDGNTDIQRASVTADGVNRREKDRTTLGFSWNYAEENDILTQRRTFGRAQYDYFLSERAYALVDGSGQADSQAGLELRLSAGAGAGYQFLENDTWDVGGEAGVAYIDEELVGAPKKEYAAARLAYDVVWQTTKTVSLEQHMRVYPSLEDKDDIFGQLDTRAKLTLSEAMFTHFQWLFDYNNTPSPGRERADHLFIIGVGWSF